MALFGGKSEEKKIEKKKEQEELNKIEIYTIPHLPGVKYKALGMIFKEGSFHRGYVTENIKSGSEKLVEEMKKEAKLLEADAILDFKVNTVVYSDEKHHYSTSTAFGTAIKFVED